MLDKLLKFCFVATVLFLFFISGFLSYKFKLNHIYTNFNHAIQLFENYIDINLYNKFGDREQRNKLNNIKNTSNNNFSFYDKPHLEFENYLLIKHDHSQTVLMSSPDKVEWTWDLSNFRNYSKIMPLHLFSNGDLIIGNFENKGIYRIDKNGKIIWKSNRISHHWIDIYDDMLFIPSRKFVNLPTGIKNNLLKKSSLGKCKIKNSSFDSILILDSHSGEVRSEINLIENLSNSNEFIDILNENYKLNNEICKDPLHLNDIQVVDIKTKIILDKFLPNISKGDLILSFRSINSIIFYDHLNKKIKHIVYNLFDKQHSPRVHEDGHLYVFDNNPGGANSKIVKINILTNTISSTFEDIKFKSDVKGRIQFLDNKLFVQSSSQGEVFQIICDEIFFENCLSKYLYSSNFSYFYPSNMFDSSEIFKKDAIYIADFYKKDYVKFLD